MCCANVFLTENYVCACYLDDIQALGRLFPKNRRTLTALPHSGPLNLNASSVMQVLRSEYGSQVSALFNTIAPDLWSHPYPAQELVLCMQSTVAQTNQMNRANDDRFGIHNNIDMASTVREACQKISTGAQTTYSNFPGKAAVNAITATVRLATYQAQHDNASAAALTYYRTTARPYAGWNAFQAVDAQLVVNLQACLDQVRVVTFPKNTLLQYVL